MSVQEATQGGRVRISVVMPAYNREEYIGEAIDSILCQTIEDFELLVIDDGSTDGTVKIVEEKYSRDRRVRLLKNARNLGIAFTRNIGIYESRGEYIAFMDSDDISLPSRLQMQMEFLDKNPEIGFCGSWMQLYGYLQKSVIKYPSDDEVIRARMFFRMSLANPTIMFRRDLFISENKLSFDTAYRMGSDYDFWVRAMAFTKAANLKTVLLQYRVHPKQIVSIEKENEVLVKKSIHRKLFEKLGISFSEQELNIHEKLWVDGASSVTGYIGEAENWLIKLQSINEAQKFFNIQKFQEELYRIWLFCCLNNGLDIQRVKKIFTSNLVKLVPLRVKLKGITLWFGNKIVDKIN